MTLRSGRVVGSPTIGERYEMMYNWAYSKDLMERCCAMLEDAIVVYYISKRVTFANSYLDQIQTALEYAPRVLNYLRIYCAPSIRYGDENAEKIYALAQRIASSKDDTEAKASSENMTQFVQDHLKKHLPCYYHSDGSPKDKAEIHAYHLKQRWTIGSEAMQLANLQACGYLPKEIA